MIDQELAQSLKAWPFKEALQIIKKNGGLLNFKIPSKGYVLLETGYGPSGLPHIGTFGEVVRTSMVKNAFSSIIDCPTRLITFSDDMDGLRKVPENVFFSKLNQETFNFTNSLKLLLGKKIRIKANYNE